MSEVFRFNNTLMDAIKNGDIELANEVERRLEQWLEGKFQTAGLSLVGGKFRPTHAHFTHLTNTTSQSIPHNTNTTLSFNTADYDPEGYHNGTTSITPTVAGWYRVSAVTSWQGMAAANRVIMALLRAGSSFTGVDRLAGGSSPDMTAAHTIHLNGSQAITCLVYHNSGVNRSVFYSLSAELVVADS